MRKSSISIEYKFHRFYIYYVVFYTHLSIIRIPTTYNMYINIMKICGYKCLSTFVELAFINCFLLALARLITTKEQIYVLNWMLYSTYIYLRASSIFQLMCFCLPLSRYLCLFVFISFSCRYIYLASTILQNFTYLYI